MTTISRLNTTISDHTMLTNFIAICLLISGCLVGVIAANQSSSLTQSSFATSSTVTSTTQTIDQASALTLSVGNASPLSLQNQPKNATEQLQPAQNTLQSDAVAVTALQPAPNTIQLTGGANLQDTTNILQ